ncbi:MAG TPA: hypothetical protein ENJ87_02550 [Gammaproteobacteria bacterium]|nr:hypothetical protein [Gammaproteobacteria bacterium]
MSEKTKQMIKQKNSMQFHTEQQGFVLIMALVLLAVMTLIGVASMNSANMELKATANARQHQVAFNAVHSLLEYTLSDGAVTTGGTPIDYQTTSATPQSISYALVNAASLQASVVFAGCSSGVGSSLEAGKGVSYNFYSIAASGSNTTGTSSSLQNRGVRYPSASCGSL